MSMILWSVYYETYYTVYCLTYYHHSDFCPFYGIDVLVHVRINDSYIIRHSLYTVLIKCLDIRPTVAVIQLLNNLQ